MLMERDVVFDCGHEARRVAKNGRSLVGEKVRCSGEGCHCDHLVVDESDARPLSVLNARGL